MKPTHTCMVVRKVAKALGSDCSIDPSARVSITADPYGTDFSAFRRDYLLANITRKLADAGGSGETRAAALKAFRETERLNRQRNNNILEAKGLYNNNALVLRILRARSIIAAILGKLGPDVLRACHFTNGASTSRTRREAFVELKYVPTWDALKCTKRAYPLFQLYAQSHLLAYEEAIDVDVIRGVAFNEVARWDSVPKDREIDRSIIVGNDCNVMLQRGLGIYIKGRLLKFGIDLSDQSRNQQLARLASIYNHLVTHDAVDSSNRIVTECVRMLLPEDWFAYFDQIAERWVSFPDGTQHRLELFSSMGNGFTFELQSLLYYALAVASTGLSIKECADSVGVFGDDVILPESAYDHFLEVIQFFGMEANERKTFRSGPFRESCGAHWYNGLCVRPFFIREPLTDNPHATLKLINELKEWYYGPSIESGDPNIDAILSDLIATLPESFKNQVPSYMDLTSGVHFPWPSLRPLRVRVDKRGQTYVRFQASVDVATTKVLRTTCDLPWYLYVLWSGNGLEGRRHLVGPPIRKVQRLKHYIGRVSMQGLPWAKVHCSPGGN